MFTVRQPTQSKSTHVRRKAFLKPLYYRAQDIKLDNVCLFAKETVATAFFGAATIGAPAMAFWIQAASLVAFSQRWCTQIVGRAIASRQFLPQALPTGSIARPPASHSSSASKIYLYHFAALSLVVVGSSALATTHRPVLPEQFEWPYFLVERLWCIHCSCQL